MMFPQEGVRFIAINSNFDSTRPHENEFTPFLNIMNEYYARDTSEKIMSIFDSKMRDGHRVSSSVPYGYTMSTEGERKLIVEPEAAKVVARIYEMKAGGASVGEICRTLTEEKVLTPAAYTKIHHPNECRAIVEDGFCRWNICTITEILHRKEYLGHTVLKKSVSTDFKQKLHRPTTEEEQYFFPNTHEPIISQELWDKAQRSFRTFTRHTEHDAIKD